MSEQTRKKLASAASTERTALSDNARARIARRITQDGPRVVRRARIERVVVRASMAVSAVAVVAIVTGLTLRSRSGVEAPLVPLAKRCETFPSKLGERADAVPAPDTQLRLSELAPCRAIFDLAQGTVFVHAKDLGGGELSVRTPTGEAHVRGTMFSVTQRDTLEVGVVEGVVEVTAADGTHEKVRAGQKLIVGAKGGPIRQSLTGDERQEIERAFDGKVAVIAPSDLFDDDAPSRPRRVRKVKRVHRDEKSVTGTAPREDDIEEEVIEEEPAPHQEPKDPLWPKPEKKAEPPPQKSAEELATFAESMRKAKEWDRARTAYREAGALSGASAEAAWLRLAQLELELGKTDAARGALDERTKRFGKGTLAIEAAWILVRVLEKSNALEDARDAAESLVRDYPRAPQAEAARQWLAQHPQR